MKTFKLRLITAMMMSLMIVSLQLRTVIRFPQNIYRQFVLTIVDAITNCFMQSLLGYAITDRYSLAIQSRIITIIQITQSSILVLFSFVDQRSGNLKKMLILFLSSLGSLFMLALLVSQIVYAKSTRRLI